MNLFKRYISNQYSREDLKDVARQLNEDKPSREVNEEMQHHWWELKGNDAVNDQVNFEQILSNIHHQINLLDNDKRHSLTPQLRLWSIVGKVAAILLLPLMAAGFWLSFHYLKQDQKELTFTVSTTKGQQSKIALSDGSEVWLNSESSLVYSSAFGQKNRNLQLIGEGYFKVAKNKELPFVVNTNKLSVTALGTVFNVDASRSSAIVTLVGGLVKVKNPIDSLLLKPGEQITADNISMHINTVDTELFTSWHQGVLIFKNELLEDITHQLEKKYDVKFIFKTDSLRNFRYRGRLKLDYSILKSLEILQLSTGLDYQISGRNIILDKGKN